MSESVITSSFAAVFALVLIPLTIQVGLTRIKTGVFFGDGGNAQLARRRAAQSNFVQYVPFALFMVLLCELNQVADFWLLAIGGALLVGRSLHAYSMLATDGVGNTRAAGMLFTFLSFLISAISLLVATVGGAANGL